MEFELVKEADEKSEIKTETPQPEIKNTEIKNEVFQSDKEEKRGRHKKDCNCDKCKEKRGEQKAGEENKNKSTPPPQQKNGQVGDDDFLNLVDGYSKATPTANGEQAQAQQPPAQTILISGYVFLICLDAVIPSLCLKLFKMINKKAADIDVKKVKLTKDQIKALEPIADQAAKIIFEQMHPVPALILGMGFMYIGNIMTELD